MRDLRSAVERLEREIPREPEPVRVVMVYPGETAPAIPEGPGLTIAIRRPDGVRPAGLCSASVTERPGA